MHFCLKPGPASIEGLTAGSNFFMKLIGQKPMKMNPEANPVPHPVNNPQRNKPVHYDSFQKDITLAVPSRYSRIHLPRSISTDYFADPHPGIIRTI